MSVVRFAGGRVVGMEGNLLPDVQAENGAPRHR